MKPLEEMSNLELMQTRRSLIGELRSLPKDSDRRLQIEELAAKILQTVGARGGLTLDESYAVSLGAPSEQPES